LAIRRRDRFATPSEFAEALASASVSTSLLHDDDVSRLLARAAELDATHNAEEPALSIGGVEQIAAQVGIPPARIREAASDLPPAPGALVPRRGVVTREPPGWPNTLVVEHVVDGELDTSAYEDIVATIHSTLNLVGHSSTLGHALHWTCVPSSSSDRDVRITVSQADGKTTIHIEEHLGLRGTFQFAPGLGMAGGAVLGALVGSIFGGTDASIGMMVVLCAAGGAVTAARFALSAKCNNRSPDLRMLADRIAEVALTAGTTND
jgi:hypothetical protein